MPSVPGASLRQWEPQAWAIADDWRPVVNHFLASPAGQQVAQAICQRIRDGATVYPPTPFRALELTPLATVKVVVLGQDPYHGPGQAQGLAFSVAAGSKPPPSLRNIFKELTRDSGIAASCAGFTGSLAGWAEQGVLLLNTSLTVEAGQPASHAQLGWHALADAVLQAVAQRDQPVVFMLWGAHAQACQSLLSAACTARTQRHLVLTANHPSPLSALRAPQPFIGCGHFSKANAFLALQGTSIIDWFKFDDDSILRLG